MRQKPVFVVDILREVVAKTEAKVLAEIQAAQPDRGIVNINFVPGTPLEITDVLDVMGQQPTGDPKRFPLVGVFLPIREGKGRQIGIDGIEGIRICIAMVNRNLTDRTPERYERNFKPILYPIYYEFLNQLDADKRILSPSSNGFKHTKIDWPYYDPNEQKNAFNEYVDAIEIRDLELLINLKHC